MKKEKTEVIMATYCDNCGKETMFLYNGYQKYENGTILRSFDKELCSKCLRVNKEEVLTGHKHELYIYALAFDVDDYELKVGCHNNICDFERDFTQKDQEIISKYLEV